MQADMVTYGKTLGGGLPVGVVCGRSDLMKRFRDDRPADICFARGTFNSHPYVMGAMNEFLQRLETPEVRGALRRPRRALERPRRGAERSGCARPALPVQVANLSSIWTVCYTRPSRYNWMLQYYLRAEGLALSWVGTGRLIFSLNYYRRRFRRGRGPLRRRGHGDAAGRLVVARTGDHQQVDQAAAFCARCSRTGFGARDRPEPDRVLTSGRNASSVAALLQRRRPATAARDRVDQLAAQQVQRRLVVELDVVERVGEDLGRPTPGRSARPG